MPQSISRPKIVHTNHSLSHLMQDRHSESAAISPVTKNLLNQAAQSEDSQTTQTSEWCRLPLSTVIVDSALIHHSGFIFLLASLDPFYLQIHFKGKKCLSDRDVHFFPTSDPLLQLRTLPSCVVQFCLCGCLLNATDLSTIIFQNIFRLAVCQSLP